MALRLRSLFLQLGRGGRLPCHPSSLSSQSLSLRTRSACGKVYSYPNQRISTAAAAGGDGQQLTQPDKQRNATNAVADGGGQQQQQGKLWRKRSPMELSFPFGHTGSALLMPSKLGNALMQVSNNINKMLESLQQQVPWRFFRRAKKDDHCYRFQFEVPGLGKDDIKVTVEDGVLVIRGERKEENKGSEDEEDSSWWSSWSYGYYDTSLLLPDDAKVDEITAEVRNGMLYVTVPRSEDKKITNVREVEIH